MNAYRPEVGAVNTPVVLLYPFPTLVLTVSKTKVYPFVIDLKSLAK